jgi:hypothetical protein
MGAPVTPLGGSFCNLVIDQSNNENYVALEMSRDECKTTFSCMHSYIHSYGISIILGSKVST